MNESSLHSLIIGLLIGGIIYFLSTVIPEPTLSGVVRVIAVIVFLIVVVNFILALLGFAPLIAIGK